MNRVRMKDFQNEIGMCPNSIRYYMETGQLPIGIILKNRTGKPRFLIFREMIDECTSNGVIEKLMQTHWEGR